MKIPISLKLKKKLHQDIAYAQDLVVEEVYRVFDRAVLHGGTAIWRCYQGSRFSEDIDAYIEKNEEKINLLFDSLSRRGLEIVRKKISENSIYSLLRLGRTETRFEAVFKKIKNYLLKSYETCEGNLINVFTLSPEDLIQEKIDAYLKRRKIRDLYDIFFLLNYAEKEKVKKSILRLLSQFIEPEDKSTLKDLIIVGSVPSAKEIFEEIKRWAK
ncbi:MAG: nucleotidyl transferase AbiEii/AbiGii toxin family protein [Nanoarchaeota archaeon]